LFINKNGINESRSKSYYCIAATVLELEELKEALTHKKNPMELIILKKIKDYFF
jgi:hypothetical protein